MGCSQGKPSLPSTRERFGLSPQDGDEAPQKTLLETPNMARSRTAVFDTPQADMKPRGSMLTNAGVDADNDGPVTEVTEEGSELRTIAEVTEESSEKFVSTERARETRPELQVPDGPPCPLGEGLFLEKKAVKADDALEPQHRPGINKVTHTYFQGAAYDAAPLIEEAAEVEDTPTLQHEPRHTASNEEPITVFNQGPCAPLENAILAPLSAADVANATFKQETCNSEALAEDMSEKSNPVCDSCAILLEEVPVLFSGAHSGQPEKTRSPRSAGAFSKKVSSPEKWADRSPRHTSTYPMEAVVGAKAGREKATTANQSLVSCPQASPASQHTMTAARKHRQGLCC